jgi:hypothetical protein
LYHIDMGRDRIFSFFMLKTFPHPITTQSREERDWAVEFKISIIETLVII